MFTPHGKGRSTTVPAPAPANQQIGGPAVASPTYGKGRITELEKELHQYQHIMGLLLTEKKEWAAKYDQFSQAYAQNEAILKRKENQLKEKEESLHDWQKRLVNFQISLSSREEMLNASDRILKMKQEELHELHAYEMDIMSKYETLAKKVNKEQELELNKNELNKKIDLVQNKIGSAVELIRSKIQKIIFEKREFENEKNALFKCWGLFRSSPSKKAEHSLEQKVSFGARFHKEAWEHEEDYKPSRIYEAANDSFDFIQGTPYDTRAREKEVLHPETLYLGEGRLRDVRRTRTMQGVIDEAKIFIDLTSEGKHNDQKDYVAASAGLKRTFTSLSGATTTEQCVENTEVYSDGDSSGEPRRKKQQLGDAETQAVNAATSSETRSGNTRGMKAGSERKTEASSGDDANGDFTCGVPAAKVSAELGEGKVHESSHMVLQTEAEETHTPVGDTSKNDSDAVNGEATEPDCVPSTLSDSDLGAEHDDDDDGEESPTIGKKLWTFLVT